MSFKSTSLSVFFFLILLASSFGCCTAWRHGSKPVRIAAQEVLLIWDAERGVEHFVRRANFQSENSPKDFGFLVPPPTQPKLSEVPDRVFDELGELIKPKVETRRETKVSFMPLILAPLFATAGSSTKDMAAHWGGVEVLDTAVVGGFEVSVLRASESGALIAWLEENGYDARPEIRAWVAPYVEKKWIVTAFKYAADADQSHAPLTRASVCLSFGTEAPFSHTVCPAISGLTPGTDLSCGSILQVARECSVSLKADQGRSGMLQRSFRIMMKEWWTSSKSRLGNLVIIPVRRTQPG